MPESSGAAAAYSDAFLAYVTTAFPNTAAHWVGYESESDFVDVMSQDDYSRDPTDDRPAFSAGIVFTSGSPDWEYTVRWNLWFLSGAGAGGGGACDFGAGRVKKVPDYLQVTGREWRTSGRCKAFVCVEKGWVCSVLAGRCRFFSPDCVASAGIQ